MKIEEKQLPNGWEVRKLGEVCEILDNLRKPINSTERQQRILGKNQKDLFPYYGATGQVGWIDNFITNGDYILVGEDGAPFLDLFKEKAYKISGKTWVNNHAHVLKGKKEKVLDLTGLDGVEGVELTLLAMADWDIGCPCTLWLV